MGEKDQRTDQGRRIVLVPAPQPNPASDVSICVPHGPIYPADLRRLPDEEPERWLERLQQIPEDSLPLPLQLTCRCYIGRAKELIRQAQETPNVISQAARRSSKAEAAKVAYPPNQEAARQAVLSTLDRAKEAFQSMSAADQHAFLLWLADQRDEHPLA